MLCENEELSTVQNNGRTTGGVTGKGFMPGQSGNPKGRPKGSLNVATVLERELKQRVVINEGGQRRTVTKLEAAIKQVVNKAAGGDLAALKLLNALVSSAEERAVDELRREPQVMSENDQKVMQGVLQRLNRSLKEATSETQSV